MEQSSIKFLTSQGITCVRGHPASENDSYNAIGESTITIGDAKIDILDIRKDLHTQRGKPVKDVRKIPLVGTIEKYLQIGFSLQEAWKSNLIDFLK